MTLDTFLDHTSPLLEPADERRTYAVDLHLIDGDRSTHVIAAYCEEDAEHMALAEASDFARRFTVSATVTLL